MQNYHDLIRKTLTQGNIRTDRTNTGTISLFGEQLEFDLAKGFPLDTSRQVFMRGNLEELFWMLRGSTDNTELTDRNVNIWSAWQAVEVEFDDNFSKRKVVYVEPRIKPYSDYYNPDRSGVSAPNDSVDDSLRSQWLKMMDRCYNPQAHNYRYYGARQIFVDERWHKLQNFIDDVKKLPNWKHKLADWNNYNLDKDYFSSNCYSRETCLWLSKKENAIYGTQNNTVLVIFPDGQSNLFVSISSCAEELDISHGTATRFSRRVPEILKGENKKLKGVKFGILDQPFRYEIPKLGDLGPVYGRQWRFWGEGNITKEGVLAIVNRYQNDEVTMYKVLGDLFKNKGIHRLPREERLQWVEDMHEAGVPTAMTKMELAQAQRGLELYPDDQEYLAKLDKQLDERGVPSTFNYTDQVDQIVKLIDDLKARPNSRRHIISAWNVAQLPDESKSPHQNVLDGKMALAPCHTLFQYYVEDRSVQDMIPELPEDVQRTFKWFVQEHGLHHLCKTIPNIGTKCNLEYWEAMFDFEKRQKLMGFFKQHGVKTQKLSCKLYQRSH